MKKSLFARILSMLLAFVILTADISAFAATDSTEDFFSETLVVEEETTAKNMEEESLEELEEAIEEEVETESEDVVVSEKEETAENEKQEEVLDAEITESESMTETELEAVQEDLLAENLESNYFTYNGQNFYRDDEGILQSGWIKVEDEWKYFDPENNFAEAECESTDGYLYILKNKKISYFSEKTTLVKESWMTINNKRYYFDSEGFAVLGWQKRDGYWYYATSDGSMAQGVTEIDGENFYFTSNYFLSTGWKKIDGEYRFFNNAVRHENCYELTYSGKVGGWVTLSDGRRSYISATKGVLCGLWNISKKKYYFDKKGIMQKNSWHKVNGYWYYATSDGSMAKGVTQIDGENYYFTTNYNLATGWKIVDGAYRFFNNAVRHEDCYELTYSGKVGGWVTLSDGRRSYISATKGVLCGLWNISKKKYYFDKKGIMQKNSWHKVNGYWYYATSDGSLAKGVTEIDGENFYFTSNYFLSTGWKKIDGTYRFFNNATRHENCYELTYSGNVGGWVTISDGRKSYISATKGVLTGGLWTISKKKYYFDKKGIMQSGWQTVKGEECFFNLEGVYIPMDAPVIASVSSNVYGEAIIKWNKTTGVDDYILQYSTSSEFSSESTTTVELNDITTYQYVSKGLTPDITYYFRLKYSAQGGEKSNPVTATSNYGAVKSLIIKGEDEATSTSAQIVACQIVSGSRNEGITVEFEATLSQRLKSADAKYYVVQTESYGNEIDVETPCAELDKDFSVSAKFDIKGKSSQETRSLVNQTLMNKFALAILKEDGTYQVVSEPMGIKNPEMISENTEPIMQTVSKKGLQGVGYDAAADTNSKHTLFNLDLANVVGSEPADGYVAYEYKGNTYYFSDCSNLVWEFEQMQKGYDQYIQGDTDEKTKICVTLNLLLSYKSSNSYLIDPAARSAGHRYYTLNVREEKARETLEAVFLYLGELFGQSDCFVTHWVLGNEVNSSKAWNYQGSLSQDAYMQSYASAFRLLYNGVKASKTGNNVYISLDNGWTAAPDTYSGKSILDKFAAYAQKENEDMLWSIAYHGYSYPLTRTDFWNDNSNTTFSTSTKYISMKNISVLTDYAASLEQKYEKPAGSIRVILSEQGYTASAGQYSQAYALARGYYMAEFNDRVDAFIIRALQDDLEEIKGGLYLGLRTRYEEKRASFYTYEYMDSSIEMFADREASSISNGNKTKVETAQEIICETNWESIIPGFSRSKLAGMY